MYTIKKITFVKVHNYHACTNFVVDLAENHEFRPKWSICLTTMSLIYVYMVIFQAQLKLQINSTLNQNISQKTFKNKRF